VAPEIRPYRLNEEMARLGRKLVAHLFVLFKTSQHYSEGHAALNAPLSNVLKVVREIQRRNVEASLKVKGGHLFLGELRLRLDAAAFAAGRRVMDELTHHRVGRLWFGEEAGEDDLRRLVYAFREVDDLHGSDPYGALLARMQRRMVAGIEVDLLPEEAETVEIDREELRDEKLRARRLYVRAVAAMDGVMGQARAGQPLALRECKRVVQRLIDLLAGQEPILLGLTTQRCHDAYTQHHAANVCILSLAMGRRLGLSKFHLCELGMAALFHDLGKAELPEELLDKPEELSVQDLQALESHPVQGVKKMLTLKGLDTMTSRILTGIFEHHLLADRSGYPGFDYPGPSLFGRIISIADSYDRLTSSRVQGRRAYPSHQALRLLLAQGGRAYDLPLLKLLVNCLGMNPIGSLLLLDSGELAVVLENNPDPEFWDSPKVRIIADQSGRELDGEVLDLAEQAVPRSIIATLDPHPFRLDVSRYFR